MSRQFKTVDYEAPLDTTVRLGDCLLQDHLARFVVDIVAQLDLSALYARYARRGGQPYAPEILVGLLFYAYATGVSRPERSNKAPKKPPRFASFRAISPPTPLPPSARTSCPNSRKGRAYRQETF